MRPRISGMGRHRRFRASLLPQRLPPATPSHRQCSHPQELVLLVCLWSRIKSLVTRHQLTSGLRCLRLVLDPRSTLILLMTIVTLTYLLSTVRRVTLNLLVPFPTLHICLNCRLPPIHSPHHRPCLKIHPSRHLPWSANHTMQSCQNHRTHVVPHLQTRQMHHFRHPLDELPSVHPSHFRPLVAIKRTRPW